MRTRFLAAVLCFVTHDSATAQLPAFDAEAAAQGHATTHWIERSLARSRTATVVDATPPRADAARSGALPSASSLPDEGQWLPGQLREMDWEKLKARGMQIDRDAFWHPERGGVLSAAIRFGSGCSAVFVSADGLLATNHHCGFGAINRLSTTERNHLQDGFVAGERAAELPCAGVTVAIVRRIEDVTARIHAVQAKAATDLERFTLTNAETAAIIAEGEKQPHTSCVVASFFEGREYHLIYRTVLSDVRLVYAPPRAIGEFGGEVDNWEWPRHTGDFSFFRAYAAPDGTPRGHDAGNVPFRPQHYLQISRDGVREDDLVLVLGYPGATSRYLTAEAVADRQGILYPLRHRLLTAILDAMHRASAPDPALALSVASRIKSLANSHKNALGMVEGLARNATVEQKRREEELFTEWVRAAPDRSERYGAVLREMRELDASARRTMQKDLFLATLTNRGVLPLIDELIELVRAAPEKPDSLPPKELAELTKRFDNDEVAADFERVQIPVLRAALDEARGLPGDERIPCLADLLGGDTDAALEEMARSPLCDKAARLALLAGGRPAVEASSDALAALARGLAEERTAMLQRNNARQGRRLEVGQLWIEAQQAWRGRSFYPDANGTLRVSIARVTGYRPRDGVLYTPHTTVSGMLHKERGVDPFANPKALLAAAADRAKSRFFDAGLGDVPVCFLADGDTTGGNSGSPVIDGRGRLVGLNFDRVFENVAGDFGWNAERSRNICVDVRFMLWVMESVLPAPNLLAELGAQ
jgi:hypothetical protein